MAQTGNNIIVYVQQGQNWVAIAATKSDELTVDGDQLEIASRTSGEWREFLAGRKTWSLQSAWLVTTVADIRKVLLVNSTIKLRIGARTWAAASGLEGYAIVKTCKVTMQEGNLANGSFAFIGTGALT